MGAHDVQEVLKINMLVRRAHAVREGAVDIGRDVEIAPQAGIGAAETHNRLRPLAAQFLYAAFWMIPNISP